MIHCLLALVPSVAPISVGDPHELERASGWRALFDGATSAGWVRHGGDAFPVEGWDIAAGCLHLAGGGGGDIATTEHFTDFELEFEWRVAPGTNSGLKYRVAPAGSPGAMLGPEYQVLDDEAHDEPPRYGAGALYALYPATGKQLAPVGEFNHSRVVARGNRIEHWLNGVRVVECEVGDEDWEARRQASKFSGMEGFGSSQPGPIGLQDHGGEVWYKNLRVRPWPPLGEEMELFPEAGITGWLEAGDAKWSRFPGGILGETGGGGQSFLLTARDFGDFVLEVELKPELPGNSGLQVRSHRRGNGRVFGYQIEVDSSERAWSGGLYDEARRGWLDNLEDEPAARAAFRTGDWNLYRVECIGPWIRTWVNGVPAADHFDPVDLSGFIAMQVHGGNNTKVYWRNMRLWNLGTHAWAPVEAGSGEAFQFEGGTPGYIDGGFALISKGEQGPSRIILPGEFVDFAIRFKFEASGDAILRVGRRSAGESEFDFGALSQLPKLPAEGSAVYCAYGDRSTLHVNGKLRSDRRVTTENRRDELAIEVSGPKGAMVIVKEFDRLRPAD